MCADVLQLADYVQRNGRNLISGGLIPIGIGHVREGYGNALEGHELNHSYGSIFVSSSLGGYPIGGLELEVVVTKGIGRGIPVVNGPGQKRGSVSETMAEVDKDQEHHNLIGWLEEGLTEPKYQSQIIAQTLPNDIVA